MSTRELKSLSLLCSKLVLVGEKGVTMLVARALCLDGLHLCVDDLMECIVCRGV